MIDVIDDYIVPVIFFLIKKTELLKIDDEISQHFIEQGIGYEQGKVPYRGVHKFFKVNQWNH